MSKAVQCESQTSETHLGLEHHVRPSLVETKTDGFQLDLE